MCKTPKNCARNTFYVSMAFIGLGIFFCLIMITVTPYGPEKIPTTYTGILKKLGCSDEIITNSAAAMYDMRKFNYSIAWIQDLYGERVTYVVKQALKAQVAYFQNDTMIISPDLQNIGDEAGLVLIVDGLANVPTQTPGPLQKEAHNGYLSWLNRVSVVLDPKKDARYEECVKRRGFVCDRYFDIRGYTRNAAYYVRELVEVEFRDLKYDAAAYVLRYYNKVVKIQ